VIPRSVPVPLLAGVVFAAGLVLIATLMVVRQLNSSSSVRCNQRGACVPAIDSPYVAVRS
jgi:hypothetical protein